MASATRTDWLEGAAVGASVLCTAHCLALPILVAAIPALSAALALPESLHLWLLGAAVPTAAAALTQGRSVHGRSGPLIAGIAGLTFMAAGALVFEGSGAGTRLTVLGSSVLAAAHLLNWHRRHGRAHR